MTTIPSGWTRKGNRITSPNGSYITRHELGQCGDHPARVWYNCWRSDSSGCMDAGYGPEALARCVAACEAIGEKGAVSSMKPDISTYAATAAGE